MITQQHLEDVRIRAHRQVDMRGSVHVLSEELFRGALIRERRRSERSNRPFGLLLVAVNDGGGAASSPIWAAATDAVTAAKHETDIAGWFEWRALLGVILTANCVSHPPDACEGVDTRLRRELTKRLDPETLGRVSVALHVYGAPGRGEGEELCPLDPLFYPELRLRRERRLSYEVIKRGFDVVGSVTLLLVLSPLFLLIAALMKARSRESIVFRQVRIGQMMKPFTMLKFRTMYSQTDHRLHQEFVTSFIKANGQSSAPGNQGLFKLTKDPRVTPVGRLLRNTSLDELPQLWNVLRGDMSLVGPRPPLPYELECYEPWHRRRIVDAKPGLTGLWQVAGRSRTTFDEMVRLDLQYARTRSVWTDIKILLATPAAVISGKGAC